MKNNIICYYFKVKIQMFYRRLSCFIFGHVRNCYLEPATIESENAWHGMNLHLNRPARPYWRIIGKGWCAYCAQHTEEPVRLR